MKDQWEIDDEKERKQERQFFWETIRFYLLIGFHIVVIILQLSCLIYLISKL